MKNECLSCADCKEFDNPKDCKNFSGILTKLFSLVFRSDRPASIQQIKELGIQGYADKMTELKQQSIKR
ncbi:hypothetical protein ACFLTB_00370 [Chloroflexota bacterium]